MILSAQQLFLSMFWRMPFSFTKSMYCWLVNWHPWSEFSICVFATLNAFFKALMTVLVSSVSSTSQPTIQRLCQSITAVRYKKPRLIGIYVISIDHAWFGLSMTAFLRRYLSLLHPFGKIHLRIDRINIHFFHVTSGLASTDMITTCFQLCGHLSCTPCWVIGMKIINNLFAGKFGFWYRRPPCSKCLYDWYQAALLRQKRVIP